MSKIDSDIKLDFKDVLIRPKRSSVPSRSEVDLSRRFQFRNSGRSFHGIPIMASNMDTTGTFEMAKVLSRHGILTVIHKYHSVEDWKEFAANNRRALPYVSANIGMRHGDREYLRQILEAVPEIEYICIDVANGYLEQFVEAVKEVRQEFPKHTMLAGLVCTGEMVEELILAGADIIKVGIGGGSVCVTRKKTGVGYPQLSTALECAEAAHALGGHIVSDGGCTSSGDISKAFGAGADFVMLGGMFAGHDESGGELLEKNGRKFKQYFGTASKTAAVLHGDDEANYRTFEGKACEIDYRGPLEHTVIDILGGIRSTCTYVGAAKLEDLYRQTTFVRVTQQLNEVFTQFNKSE